MTDTSLITYRYRNRRFGFFAAFVVFFFAASGLLVQPVLAQSGTPTASACQAPMEVFEPAFPPLATAVPGTPTAATPVPVATEPVEPGTIAAIDATAIAYAACVTANDIETTLLLTTERFLGRAFGGGERLSDDDYRLLASSGPVIPVDIQSIVNLQFSGMRTVRGDVTFIEGKQLKTELWTFLFEPTPTATSDGTGTIGTPESAAGVWLLHDVAEVETGELASASRIPVTIREGSITVPLQPIVGPDLVVTGTNAGDEDHELLILRLDGNASTADLLRPADSFPKNIAILGQMTLAPGERDSITLVGLEPGVYTIVCLFPDAESVPHLALGEEATFAVS